MQSQRDDTDNAGHGHLHQPQLDIIQEHQQLQQPTTSSQTVLAVQTEEAATDANTGYGIEGEDG